MALHDEGIWHDPDDEDEDDCGMVRERYTYVDGSAIVGNGLPWDWALGYNDCYCKRDDGCTCEKNEEKNK